MTQQENRNFMKALQHKSRIAFLLWCFQLLFTLTYSQSIQVTASAGSGSASYNTLKETFDAINAGTHQGAITIGITANTTETATATLNASGSGSASYTAIIINPTGASTISGNIAGPLINLNGADNVTINGLNTGGDELTIENLNNSTSTGNSTIRFTNGATNNTITNCTILGSTLTSDAGILFFSTGGNTNNTVSNCNISNAGGARSRNAIYSLGSSGNENVNNTISNCTIYDIMNVSNDSYGVHLASNNSQWTISGNSFYETTTLTTTSTNSFGAIRISSSGNDFTVSGNFIGGSQASCGGSAWTKNGNNNTFHGIWISAGTTTASNIQGNTIANFSWSNSGSAAWHGIWVNAGQVNVGTTTGNTIGSASGTGNITYTAASSGANFYGIYLSGAIADCQNNTIASITTASSSASNATNFWGIFKTGAQNTTISNNIIGSTTVSNNILISSASSGNAQTLYGIQSAGTAAITISNNTIANLNNGTSNATAGTLGMVKGIDITAGTNTITNNIIRDLTTENANTNALNSASVTGICFNFTSTAVQNISENTIFNLSNTRSDFSGSIIGIYYNGSATASQVSRNHIFGLSVNAASTAAQLIGISKNGGNVTCANNLIRLGGNTQSTIYGIYETGTGSPSYIYFNTVYISGLPSAGSLSSYALWSNANSNLRDFRNNILHNDRSNNGATGSHYTLGLNYGTSTNLTLEYNNYYVSGAGGVIGRYNAEDVTILPIVANLDITSLNVNSDFTGPNGNAVGDYLPQANNLSGGVISGIITDIQNNTRGSSPSMGAIQYQVLGRIEVVSPSGSTTNAHYYLLKDAFDAINNGTHTGTIEIKINESTTENNTSSVLNASGTGSANYSGITIYPTGTNKVIKGSVSGSLIQFNGSDNVTIDGRVNSTGTAIDLEIENTNTSDNAFVINYINDAEQHTIKYSRLKGNSGSGLTGTLANGGIIFIGAGVTNGNRNITIEDNIFTRGTRASVSSVYSYTANSGPLNSNIIIQRNDFNNVMHNDGNAFIVVMNNCTQVSVLENDFYQQTLININGGPRQWSVININSSSGYNFNISDNKIGGSQPNCQGNYFEGLSSINSQFTGISLVASNNVNEESFINGNTISNIYWKENTFSYGFCGINVSGNVKVGQSSSNVIGSTSITNSIKIISGTDGSFGITASGSALIENNIIAGISMETRAVQFTGILATGNNTVSGNTIGSSIVNSINHQANGGSLFGIDSRNAITAVIENNTIQNLSVVNTSTSSGSVRGIQYRKTTTSVNANLSITNNIVRLLSTSQTATNARVIGIDIDDQGQMGTFTLNVNGNTINDLQTTNNSINTGPSAGVIGIYIRNSSNSAVTIHQNTIYNLINTSTGYTGDLAGIVLNSISSSTSVYRNFISQLQLNSTNTSAIVYGIYNSSGNPLVYNNIIALGENKPIEYIGIGDYSTSTSATRSFFYNTVYLAGSPASGNRNSSAFLSNSSAGSRDYRNNLLVNSRSNSGSATGKNYAVFFNYGTSSSLDLEYNNYYAPGTGGVIGFYNSVDVSALPVVGGEDLTSFDLNPQFANAGGTSASDYIPAEPLLAGTTISGITTDYANTPRTALTAIGAYQYNVLGRVDVFPNFGTYANVKDAFTAINNGTHQGTVQVNIKYSTVEDASAVLNASGTGSSSYTSVQVNPSGGRSVTVSGTINSALIQLNGTSNVTIDGLNAGGNSLTMTNLSQGTSASTLQFINGASNNMITKSTILGSSLASTGGVIYFGTSSGATGNNNNTLSNNLISQAGTSTLLRPNRLLFSEGSTGKINSGNQIFNNEFYNFLRINQPSMGLFLSSFTTDWTISNNSFYETSYVPSSNDEQRVINIVNTSGNNFTISNNFIGGSQVSCGGAAWTKSTGNNTFYGIYLEVGNTTASNIQGNTISNFTWINPTNSNPWYGLYIKSGTVNIGTNSGNIIGSSSGTGNITYTAGSTAQSSSAANFYGIYLDVNSITNCQNNTLASITVAANTSLNATNFWGIFKTGAGNTTISNNTIGDIGTLNSIQATSASTFSSAIQTVYGINSAGSGTLIITGNTITNLTNATTNASTSVAGLIHGINVSGGTNTITNNTIRNLRNSNLNNTGFQAASVAGIVNNSSGSAQNISQNTIYNLSNTNASFAGTVTGIFFAGGSTLNTVSRNFIYDLEVNSSSTGASIYGIRANGGTTNYSNNIIHLSSNSSVSLFGIFENGAASTTINVYFNTIHISGSLTSGSNSSYALWSNATANTRNFRNNLLVNSRSNTGSASGSHYAAFFNYASNSSLTSDFNNYFISGVGGVLGRYNNTNVTALPLVPSRDASSSVLNPQFTNLLPISSGNFYPKVQLNGTAIAGFTTDYNGSTRTTPPSMGALEAFVWTGITNTNFNTATNWSGGVVPTENAMIRFASAPSNPCLLDQNRKISTIINQQSVHGFHLNGSTLTLTGDLDFTNGASMTANTTGSQLYLQTALPFTLNPIHFSSQEINQLKVLCPEGLEITGALSVTQQLELEDGMVILNDGDLSVGSLIVTPNSTRYIQTDGSGKLISTIPNTASFLFPVGKSAYNPVTITNKSGSPDEFSVNVSDEVLYNSYLNLATYVNRTWNIDKQNPNGGAGIDFDFAWNTSDIVSNSGPLSSALLNHYNGNNWETASGIASATVGNPNVLSLSHQGYMGSFSPFAISSSVNPLPVTLLSFAASCEDGKPHFMWTTASEINNSHFDLEQSADLIAWEKTARIQGNGNSNELIDYTYTLDDFRPYSGRYFRLHQYDYNGDSEAHPALFLSEVCSTVPAGESIAVFPNPAEEMTTVRYAGAGKISGIGLYDLTGKLLYSYDVGAGTSPVNLSLSSIKSGVYVLEISTDSGKRYSVKLIKK
jgi:hypothetical protein